jgi:hypothetical protein
MRLGLPGGRKLPPNKVGAAGLIILGGVIMLLSMPLSVWAAVVGGLIAYAGYSSMRGR